MLYINKEGFTPVVRLAKEIDQTALPTCTIFKFQGTGDCFNHGFAAINICA